MNTLAYQAVIQRTVIFFVSPRASFQGFHPLLVLFGRTSGGWLSDWSPNKTTKTLIKQLGTPCDRCTKFSGHSNLIALITCLCRAIIYLVAACLSSLLYCQFPGEQESLCFVPRCVSGPSTMPDIRKELQKNLLSGRRSWQVTNERENLKSWIETRLPPLNNGQNEQPWSSLAFVLPEQIREGRMARIHKAETFGLQLGWAGCIIYEMLLSLNSTLSGIV